MLRSKRVRFAIATVCGALVLAPTAARDTHALSDGETLQWIAAVQSHETQDGATVLEALEHARRLRPDTFAFGRFDVGYDSREGEPDAVMVETWIGSKRQPDDVTRILIPARRTAGKLVVAIPVASGIFLGGLRRGRDALVRAIDEEYGDLCIDAATHAKLC